MFVREILVKPSCIRLRSEHVLYENRRMFWMEVKRMREGKSVKQLYMKDRKLKCLTKKNEVQKRLKHYFDGLSFTREIRSAVITEGIV